MSAVERSSLALQWDGKKRCGGYERSQFDHAAHALFSNSSRPISMRLISLVPAPIS
jgi:hypothetical protein